MTRAASRFGYRLLIILAGAVVAVWAGTSPVLAHTTLTSTNPADQEKVQVVVAGPSGQTQQGQPRLRGNSVTQELQAGPPAGTATQPPSSPEASPPATPDQSQPTRMPGWLKLAIGVVAIIIGLRVARDARRRGNANRP